MIRKPEDLPSYIARGLAQFCDKNAPQSLYKHCTRPAVFLLAAMRKYIPVFIILLLALGIYYAASSQAEKGASLSAREPARIASLSPGITETLYALGQGEKMAGATQFCLWPPEAANLPRVAGFRELNLEALARTRPDLVVLPEDMAHFTQNINALGIPVTTFDGQTLSGFVRDVRKLGMLCGASQAAEKLATGFDNALAQNSGGEKDRPSVLLSLMHPEECARPVTELSIIGADGFYSDLISLAGGRNAYTGSAPYPRLSREAILALDPDLLVLAAPGCDGEQSILDNWSALSSLKALRNRNVVFLNDPGDTIPGPRSLHTLARLKEAMARVEAR